MAIYGMLWEAWLTLVTGRAACASTELKGHSHELSLVLAIQLYGYEVWVALLTLVTGHGIGQKGRHQKHGTEQPATEKPL